MKRVNFKFAKLASYIFKHRLVSYFYCYKYNKHFNYNKYSHTTHLFVNVVICNDIQIITDVKYTN